MIRITNTENGKVQGLPAADPRITTFKGIPFAAPPVGKNRWRAPQPCENWNGTLKAYQFAPISVQDTPGIGDDIYIREWHVDPEIPMDEDCLYLNIWTSAKNIDEKQPVFVWIFGGAFQWGYSAEMEFDGERLARRGIVVVTINYRLNSFGFLAHPELTKEQPDAPTNFGCLDQQAALKWVNRNIKNFGGDPDNITLGGQSAGGGSVLTQLTNMKNTGLFQKAIIASAMLRSPYKDNEIGKMISIKELEELGVKFFEYLGVNSLEEARELPALYIRDKYSQFWKENAWFSPCIDGIFCEDDSISSLYKGKHLPIPMMIGNTTNEFPNTICAESKEEFIKRVNELFGDKSDEFLSYKEALNCTDNKYAAVSGLECTIKGVISQLEREKDHQNCYYYKFDAEIPGWDNPGTFHSVDLWFFFESLAKCWRPFNGKHYDLSRQMCNYWADFMKTGDPNGNDNDGSKMTEWKPYTQEVPCEMIFSMDGPKTNINKNSDFITFLIDRIKENITNELEDVTE